MKRFLADIRQIPDDELPNLVAMLELLDHPDKARMVVCLALEMERRRYVPA